MRPAVVEGWRAHVRTPPRSQAESDAVPSPATPLTLKTADDLKSTLLRPVSALPVARPLARGSEGPSAKHLPRPELSQKISPPFQPPPRADPRDNLFYISRTVHEMLGARRSTVADPGEWRASAAGPGEFADRAVPYQSGRGWMRTNTLVHVSTRGQALIVDPPRAAVQTEWPIWTGCLRLFGEGELSLAEFQKSVFPAVRSFFVFFFFFPVSTKPSVEVYNALSVQRGRPAG